MMIETLRDIAQRKKWLAWTLAVTPLVLALIIATVFFLPDSTPDSPAAYYIDEETGVVSVRPENEYPPLTGASGRRTVVRAVYLTASDPTQKFLAYYEKYTDEAIQRLQKQTAAEALRVGVDSPLKGGVLVRGVPPGSPWVNADGPEGIKLIQEAYIAPPGTAPLRPCLP